MWHGPSRVSLASWGGHAARLCSSFLAPWLRNLACVLGFVGRACCPPLLFIPCPVTQAPCLCPWLRGTGMLPASALHSLPRGSGTLPAQKLTRLALVHTPPPAAGLRSPVGMPRRPHARRRASAGRGYDRGSTADNGQSAGCSAAWLARLTGGQEVGGSNPPTPISFTEFTACASDWRPFDANRVCSIRRRPVVLMPWRVIAHGQYTRASGASRLCNGRAAACGNLADSRGVKLCWRTRRCVFSSWPSSV